MRPFRFNRKVLLFFCLLIGSGLLLAENWSLVITNDSSTSEEAIETAEASDDGPSDEEQFETAEVTQQSRQEVEKIASYWSPPNYENQDGALGWTPDAFKIPPGMEERVAFWIDVYTKYSTTEAVLHDSKYLNVIYRVLNFGDIEKREDLTTRQKQREKQKRVKAAKAEIRDQLRRIQALQDTPGRLSPNEKMIFDQFRFSDDRKRFSKASERTRLRMQLGQKDRFEMGIFYSGRFIREMESIFKDAGLPLELTRLPFVESSFNIYAFSKVGASGIWQFMPRTGRLFKLKIDAVKDLRNDPLVATRAAAAMMKSNYQMLESWPLAVTGYNHGPGGVAKEAKRLKTYDLNYIIWNSKGRRFGFASENFYAEFLAAVHVEANANKYFGNVQVSPALVYDEVELGRATRFHELAWALKPGNMDEGIELARLYNPFFSRLVRANAVKIPVGQKVRVPKGEADRVVSALQEGAPPKSRLPSSQAGVYRVLPGDTLSGLSRDFGVSVKELVKVNRISVRSLLRPGQKLIVPGWDKE